LQNCSHRPHFDRSAASPECVHCEAFRAGSRCRVHSRFSQSTRPHASFATNFETAKKSHRKHHVGSREKGRAPTIHRFQFAAIRSLRTPGPASTTRSTALRASEWSFPSPDHRSSSLRAAIRPGPNRPDFFGHIGSPSAEPNDSFQECVANARDIRSLERR
jgi:hypothetical protein